ncbi:ComF family protein [Undibacterium flavidum]|uniref:ComF family protein n=1 Tax=Undibacterium flavidum TaxID=2762297 RepID=A0ABR6YAP5_9BURK|nr:ComF family protein [Undibacterium flavidum]MBC3873703.1 ComF family protein [Undibacterium flavidum]
MQTLLEYLLPGSCALCKMRSKTSICDGCLQDYMLNTAHRCQQCALPLTALGDKRCGTCLKDTPDFDTTLVAVQYDAPVDSLVLGLKFGAKLNYAGIIAQQLADAILRQSTLSPVLPSLLCPVPLSRGRLANRGFNQALEISRPLSRRLGIPLQADLLWRTKETLQQSSLHPDARHKNIQGAFTVNPVWHTAIHGRHIAVIDDVITTGTTLNEIAKTLKRYGAARVSNFVFARTNRH